MATSGAADALFALPETYDASDPTSGPGARRQARQAEHERLTAEQGSAAANTKLATDADNEAAKTTAAISPKVEQLATEDQLLGTTIQQLRASQPTTATPLASSLLSQGTGSGARGQALGEAREAEYYIDTANAIRGFATWWVPLILIVMGLLAILWNWYHREQILPLIVVYVAIVLGSFFPVYVMQIPRAALSPLMKLVPGPA